MRLAFVAAYMAVRGSSIVGRLQKPFNSLLGETYELVTEDYRCIAEQICHHPPTTAYHCESKQAIVNCANSTTIKFNGRYMIMQPKEPIFINLKLPSGELEHYTCLLPQITVHNLILGKMYVDLIG